MAWCHSFCLFFIFYNIHTYNHTITFIQYIYPSPFTEASLHFFIACLLSGGTLPVVPSRESNSGLPSSKPTRYQLCHAAPFIGVSHACHRSYIKYTANLFLKDLKLFYHFKTTCKMGLKIFRQWKNAGAFCFFQKESRISYFIYSNTFRMVFWLRKKCAQPNSFAPLLPQNRIQ